MRIKVLFQNKDFIAVNKPAGVLVHGIFDKYGPKHNEETLVDYVAKKYPEINTVGDKPSERPGVVHRLDRETSGVILIARTQEGFEYLKNLFKAASDGRKTKIQKTYLTLVWGKLKNKRGIINKPISIRSGTVRRTIQKGRMTREAITEYKIIQELKCKTDEFSLLQVTPKTGRTHQIRVHLNSIHHPVYGDKLYGKREDIFKLDRHFLHAQAIEITLPNDKRLTIKAELPKDLKKIITSLDKE